MSTEGLSQGLRRRLLLRADVATRVLRHFSLTGLFFISCDCHATTGRGPKAGRGEANDFAEGGDKADGSFAAERKIADAD